MSEVRAEIFVEVPAGKTMDDAMWDLMVDLSRRFKDGSLPGIRRIRLPDSPEPDLTGHVEFGPESTWCMTCKTHPKPKAFRRHFAAAHYIAAARKLYSSDEIEFDDEIQPSGVSQGDTGAFVQAWVWVSADDARDHSVSVHAGVVAGIEHEILHLSQMCEKCKKFVGKQSGVCIACAEKELKP